MPVELTIVETTLELGQTNVEVVLDSSSAPGVAGPGVPTGGTDGQVLTKTSGTDYATAWEDPTGGGGGVTDADYLVGTAHGSLSAEIVVGTSPGGELGGTWASPTVDASHSGSTHAAVQAAAEATAASALSTHASDTTAVHGIVDTSALALTADVQPLDSDLTAIAALTTTAFGRGLLELANQAALLSAAGAAAASHAHSGADITSGTVAEARIHADIARDSEVTSAISALSTVYQPLDSDLTAIAALTTTAYGRAFLAFADEAAFKAGVNLEAGTDFPSLSTFNDHSARHENGGADEISIAGLDGTPVELTNHLNDTSDAHDASAISVADSGGYITGTDVEAALQEVARTTGVSVKETNADQAIANNTETLITFNEEDFDTDGFHDNSTNPSRLTVPAGLGGKYLIVGNIAWDSNATNFRQTKLLKNGAATGYIVGTRGFADARHNITAILDLAAGDYVEMTAYHDSGASRNIISAALPSKLAMTRIGS